MGPRGTFTEEALDLWIKKLGVSPEEFKKVPYYSIADMMNAVGKRLDAAVVPIENSLEGSVNIT
ncbi:MAG: prephenate dehydratase domain-containing protein, partial [Tepidanaerobacteraceae bacterium]